ncbi:hypothetical protein CLOSCI_01219 [[Clostridium] scindens ATCC 35704]|nr:hypothetical protein CLOSCI_01219 [[Clostridium] scindens ATCC 35704]
MEQRLFLIYTVSMSKRKVTFSPACCLLYYFSHHYLQFYTRVCTRLHTS